VQGGSTSSAGLPCPAGMRCVGGSNNATNCTAGNFAASTGAPTCGVCGTGQYSLAGATGCLNCTAPGGNACQVRESCRHTFQSLPNSCMPPSMPSYIDTSTSTHPCIHVCLRPSVLVLVLVYRLLSVFLCSSTSHLPSRCHCRSAHRRRLARVVLPASTASAALPAVCSAQAVDSLAEERATALHALQHPDSHVR
jgi:hypothetical protein